MNDRPFARFSAAAFILLFLLSGCATTDTGSAWPEKNVSIHHMQATDRIHTRLLLHNMDKSRASTVVLRLHVDENGNVVKAAVLESSGNPRIDGAAMGAMRKTKFLPYVGSGTPIPVTVVAPMHFPAIH